MLRKIGIDTLDASDSDFKASCTEYVGREGFDVILEASGSKDAALGMTELLGVRGRILAIGVHKVPPAVDLTQVAFKELQIIGTRVYTKRDFEKALRLAATNQLGIGKLISHRFDIARARQGLEAMEDANSSMKVLMIP